jgi:sterol 3beta-glucosyltransferase
MAAALISGKPQMIIPFAADQPFWAKLLYQKGYGVKPLKEKDINVEALGQRFLEMETDKYINNAIKIKDIISKENGVGNAVSYIENIVENN